MLAPSRESSASREGVYRIAGLLRLRGRGVPALDALVDFLPRPRSRVLQLFVFDVLLATLAMMVAGFWRGNTGHFDVTL
ncbi:MAG: hypothetical protein JWN63_2829 [Candidatus Acidoferrum typicum]|nr:hypothetical protein [Candidatus Acidoferrum typicum]